jgi:DNA polymerase kappa
MLAKICSDKNKPNGQFTCPSDREGLIEFTTPLTIRLVPGIGRVTERCLQALGILTCGDIITKKRELHLLDYGTTALLKASLGCTSNECVPGKKADRKTVGVERFVLSEPFRSSSIGRGVG